MKNDKKRILLVDDERDITIALRIGLTKGLIWASHIYQPS
jgi:hypothetical protein